MDEISRVVLGKYARPKEKINLMGEILLTSIGQPQEKSDDEVRAEVMSRFERLGLKQRAISASHLEEEITSEGFQSIVYFLYRLSLSLDDGQILKRPRSAAYSNFSLLADSHSARGLSVREKTVEKGDTNCTDDGCAESARDSPSLSTRLPSGHLTHEFLSLLSIRTRANPMQRECVETCMAAVSCSLCDALSGRSTFLFEIQDGVVSTISPLVISNHSISQTRAFLRPITVFLNELLMEERLLLDSIQNARAGLVSQLSLIVIEYLKTIREEANLLLYIRPFPCVKSIRKNIEIIMEKGDLFILLSRLLMELRNSSCVECIDSLVSYLSHETIEEELTAPILTLLRFALDKTIEDAEWFMLSGEVSPLGLVLETGSGSTLNESYRSGRIEGERWRKNYNIRVGQGQSVDKTTAEEIMAEGKLALMRLRDPSLLDEYYAVNWHEFKQEREEERKKIVSTIQSTVTFNDIRQMFINSITWVRTCGDRSIFLSKQISLVANSLEIVWQVFLLGDRVSRVPHFDGSMSKRFQEMRDAIASFPDDHLLAVSYASKKKFSSRSASFIALQVAGALSIVVSSSNISIYTDAHKLLSKLSQVYHQISQAYLCLPPLRKESDDILRGLQKGLAEVTHWVGKLCGHFCAQVHEVVWKQTSKEVLRSLPSFDQIYAVHRKALKQLASTLFLHSSAASLSAALHSSIDTSAEFARNLEEEEWEKAAESYTNFLESAQMFTHGLLVGDNQLQRELLHIIDSCEKFRM